MSSAGRLHPTIFMQIIFKNGMWENEPFWLDSPGNEGFVSLVVGWQLIPPPSFMHVSFMEGVNGTTAMYIFSGGK